MAMNRPANRLIDQENRIPDTRLNGKTGLGGQNSKRPVLSRIDNNKPIVEKVLPKSKQNQKDANCKKNVTVPVAQFEAFKVYEDDEHMSKIDQKLKHLSNRINKPVQPAAAAPVQQADAKENKSDCEKAVEIADKKILGEALMSIEKPIDENQFPKCSKGITSRPDEDVFFEIEEYRDDILSYLKEREVLYRPKPGYIAKQPDVTETMRAILVDWLVEVAEEYNLTTETLYLSVNFIDRFLSYMSVVRAKLQLVGTAAMYIAAKYEEIFPPDVSEFVYITDDTYDRSQVIRMEQLILHVLHFNLSVPTPLTFISAISIGAKLPDKVMHLAMYLSELSMLDAETYLVYLPSILASSSVVLARHTLGEVQPWNEQLERITGYTLNDLLKCIEVLQGIYEKSLTHPQHAIQDKYKHAKYNEVSTILPHCDLVRSEQ